MHMHKNNKHVKVFLAKQTELQIIILTAKIIKESNNVSIFVEIVIKGTGLII